MEVGVLRQAGAGSSRDKSSRAGQRKSLPSTERDHMDRGSGFEAAMGSETAAVLASALEATASQAKEQSSLSEIHSLEPSEKPAMGAKRRLWLPEEAYPAAARSDGGAVSAPVQDVGPALLQPLAQTTEGRWVEGLVRANAVVGAQVRALGSTAKDLRAQYDRVQELQVQQLSKLAHSLFNKHAREVVNFGERWKQVDLLGSHELGKDTRLDTHLTGSPIRCDQVSVKLLHAGTNRKAAFGPARRRQLSISGATDLRSRSRVAVEGKLSDDAEDHTCSTILASDNLSYLSWGVTTSHRLSKKLTVFARASGDDFQGRKVILQTVHNLTPNNSISPVVAVAIGRAIQAGVGWTRQLSQDPSKLDNKISLKLLALGKGAYAVNFAFKGSGS